MPVSICEIAIDCINPMLVAKFWCEVLGYEIREEEVGLICIASADASSRDAALTFAQVPETKMAKNRLHLDLRAVGSSQQEEVDRLLNLGARFAEVGQGEDVSWVVLADPEGNEFCVLSGTM